MITINEEDRERLGQHLTGWNKLNELFVLDALSLEDLERMVIMELTGPARMNIIHKLVGRLYSRMRNETLESINLWRSLKNISKVNWENGASQTDICSTSSPVPHDVASQIGLPLLPTDGSASLSSKRKVRNPRTSR
jgi:hypothetical protein